MRGRDRVNRAEHLLVLVGPAGVVDQPIHGSSDLGRGTAARDALQH